MPKRTRDTTFIILMVILAAFVRLDFLIASKWIIDSDEGIVGLMAKHILDGDRVPVFYYGQDYMGSFEAIVAAFLFKLFGVSSIALKITPLLFSLALVPLSYRLGESVGGKIAGRTAALLWALPPSPLVVWSSMARGGFIEIVWLGSLALFLTVRWLQANKISELSTYVIALVLGFGWWVNNQIIYFIAPICFFILCRLLHEKRTRFQSLMQTTLAGLAGFITGSLPFWFYNITHGFASFGIFGNASESDIVPHLRGLFSTALPMLLGARRFWHDEDLFPGSTAVVLVLFGILTVALLAIRAGALLRLLIFSIDRRRPVELFILVILTALAAFTLSSFGHLVTAPRYLLPIYACVYVLAGYLVSFLWPLNPVVARSVVGAIFLLNFCSCYLGGRALPGQPFVALNQRASSDHSELIAWLTEHHISYVRTNYWIGYRLAFETKEKIKFVEFQEPHQIRIPEYEQQGAAIPLNELPFVLVPAQASLVKTALTAVGYSFDEIKLSDYAVLYNVAPKGGDNAKPLLEYGAAKAQVFQAVPADKFTIAANVHPNDIALAADGSDSTRWGSGEPQHPGMRVEIAFKDPLPIDGLMYNIDKWPTDYPRGLTVEVQLINGETQLVLSNEQYLAVRYLTEATPHWRIAFGPIEAARVILTETGRDSFYDWSIGEVSLLE